MMPMNHDHREQLAHLVDEWGTLGVLSVLLDDLTEATAETVIEAYRMRRLREPPPRLTWGPLRALKIPGEVADWQADEWRPGDRAPFSRDEDGWLRIADQEWFVDHRSPWRRKGWFRRTWHQETLTIPQTVAFRRDLGDPSTFRIKVTGALCGRLELLLDGVVVKLLQSPLMPTHPYSAVTFDFVTFAHRMPALNLGPHEASLRLTGQTFGGSSTPLTLAVSALPDVDSGPVPADEPDSQEWEWEGYR